MRTIRWQASNIPSHRQEIPCHPRRISCPRRAENCLKPLRQLHKTVFELTDRVTIRKTFPAKFPAGRE
jgi:hypothetical protein